MKAQALFDIAHLSVQRQNAGKPYLEFLRVAPMSAGVYVLSAGATDNQRPHAQDELYYVVSGRARMRSGAEDWEVAPGSIIFVAAEVEHRFYDIREELTLLVFFAPAESET